MIYFSKSKSVLSPNFITLTIGILYIILGNYFKTIKANYFIGISTPWTLENETVWNKTHKIAEKSWFIGGIIVVFLSFILGKQPNFIIFMIITSIIPIAYSHYIFKKIKPE